MAGGNGLTNRWLYNCMNISFGECVLEVRDVHDR